jgi:hypothetical protein
MFQNVQQCSNSRRSRADKQRSGAMREDLRMPAGPSLGTHINSGYLTTKCLTGTDMR